MQLLAKGGLFLIPIVGASIAGLALFLERMLYLRATRIVPPELTGAIKQALDADGSDALSEIHKLCDAKDSPLSRVVARGLIHAGGPRAHMRENMEDAGRRELHLMKRNTGALGAIATVAPLLGLLGTVVGMISTFQSVVLSAETGGGSVDVGQLAGGIWEALITTAAGLVVAIPVILGHRFILGRIERLLSQIEHIGGRIIDRFAADTPAPHLDEQEAP